MNIPTPGAFSRCHDESKDSGWFLSCGGTTSTGRELDARASTFFKFKTKGLIECFFALSDRHPGARRIFEQKPE
jgi:hypothetical protein